MSFFRGASGVAVLGGTHIAAVGSTFNINQGSQAFKDLSSAAAHTALHNSAARFNPPRCHRNTRAKYRNQLERWMLGHGNDFEGKQLIWLHGGAGAGKSAIMQSVVEQRAQHGSVLGSFFFSRTDSSRNYAEVLIPTLAYQVAQAFPQAMVVLDPFLQRNPLIFKASLHTQALELLVRPLLYLFENGIINGAGPLRQVFVIDGLDECNDPQKQALVIQVITSILCDHHIPVCFLIASRLEVAISSAFEGEKKLHGTFSTITLDDDDEAELDIRQFIEDSFHDILESHPWRTDIELPWPDPTSIDDLVTKSSNHFIYAATAMKYIASWQEHPGRALKVVEGLELSRIESPFVQLDALYMHIITSAKYSKRVLEILRHYYLSLFDSHSVASVCWVHDMTPQDVPLYLSDVQSLVSLVPTNIGELCISPKHASLGDFLWDPVRSQGLYIAEQDYHASLLARYLQLLDDGPQKVPLHVNYKDVGSLSLALSYAVQHSEDTNLLRSLVSRHSAYSIWNFYVESLPLEATSWSDIWGLAIALIYCYMFGLCHSDSLQDNVLYSHQVKMYLELVLDYINDLTKHKPQYHIIPALVFSSSRLGLLLTQDLIGRDNQFYIGRFNLSNIFLPLCIFNDGRRRIDPRTLEVIRLMPQSQMSWSTDLAIAMKLVLHRFIHLSEPGPSILHLSPHKKWLQKHKGLKQRSLGSPRMSSAKSRYDSNPFSYSHHMPFSFLYSCWHRVQPGDSLWKIKKRRQKYRALLRAVICYLPKSDCTNEVVLLARRSLPMVALWFPKLMRRARAEMDAYVRRWEESPEGLLEMTKSLHINDVD